MLQKLTNIILGSIIVTAVLGLVIHFGHDATSKLLFHKAGPKIVQLVGPMGAGTGFHLEAPSGEVYIVTNAHVCEIGATHVRQGLKLTQRDILDIDPSIDLCLLEGMEDQSGLKMGSHPHIHDRVYIMGHGLGGPMGLDTGHIKSRTTILGVRAYMTDVVTYPGNSGSPMLDRWGRVTGVLFAGDPRSNWGAVVHFESLKDFVRPH